MVLEKLRQQGGDLQKAWMYSVEDSHIRGMIATDNIQEGELIAFIPRSMMINYIDAEKDFCTICSEFEPVGWMTR